jgi:hypothetical protein
MIPRNGLELAVTLDLNIAGYTNFRICQLGAICAQASSPYWRPSVLVTPPQELGGSASQGSAHEGTWFPPSQGPSSGLPSVDVLSFLLYRGTAGVYAQGNSVGWLQIFRGTWIWFGWENDMDLYIEWETVQCIGSVLYGVDQHSRTWSFDLDVWHAGVKPDWPEWPEWANLPKVEA